MSSPTQRQCLSLKTNHQKSLKKSKFQIFHNLVFACCLLLILISQTNQTYTNTFIDHKTLLTPKQLITNTLKQIKPKFNPRHTSSTNDKHSKLNVYDLMAGEVKGGGKKHQPTNEQMSQGTYYYTDYKLPVTKNLIPMTPHCPETGRTVCKEAKAYPVDSILNLIMEAKANKFNFSSLFVDESQNSDMPNLPELESTIAKSCSGGEKAPEQYDNSEKEDKQMTNSKTNTNQNLSGYKGVKSKSKSNYKRPGDSAVHYDNNNDKENYSPYKSTSNKFSTPNHSNENSNNDNYDKYEEQRISNNENQNLTPQTKSYENNQMKKLPVMNPQQAPVDHSYSRPIQQQPIQTKQSIYQQPQSSIKFEQQYQNKQFNNRHPNYRPSSENNLSSQDLNYRNTNQNSYYHHQSRKISDRPYKTTVTIIPFIQYITQLPTNDYQISTDKQLLDTISQSLRHTPLNSLNYAPDAWLPIKAYTTTDIQQREIEDHLSNDRLHASTGDHLSNDELASSEYIPNYTPNYRDKRSTCKDDEDKLKEKNENNKTTDKNSNSDDDENSSITRVKKQAGFDEEPEELCLTKRLFITPKAALNDKSEWRYIVNVGERDTRLKQLIKVDVCASPNGPCSSQISLPFGYISKCKQKYIKKKLLAIDPDGQSTSTESFFIPSCCVCEIVRINQK